MVATLVMGVPPLALFGLPILRKDGLVARYKGLLGPDTPALGSIQTVADLAGWMEDQRKRLGEAVAASEAAHPGISRLSA